MKRRASEYPVELPDFIAIHRPPPHEETESTKYKSFPRDKPGSSGVALIRITGFYLGEAAGQSGWQMTKIHGR
jgi:hypothetical protein